MKYAVGYDWESKTAAWNQQAIDYVLLGRPLSAHQVFFFLQSPMYTLYCPRVTWSGQFAFDVLLPALNWAAIRRSNGQAALSPALSPSLSSPELSNRIVLCHLSSRAVKHHRYRLRLACMLSSCHRPLGTVICLLRLQDGLQSMTKTRQHIILTA